LTLDPGSGMEKSGSGDKHPGFATLVISLLGLFFFFFVKLIEEDCVCTPTGQ
jgi:hypothetical protein